MQTDHLVHTPRTSACPYAYMRACALAGMPACMPCTRACTHARMHVRSHARARTHRYQYLAAGAGGLENAWPLTHYKLQVSVCPVGWRWV